LLNHVLVIPTTRAGLERHRARNALRHAALRAAVYLARAAIGHAPATTEVLETAGPSQPRREGVPRMAYIGQIHSRQMVAEVDEQIFYGMNTTGMVPVMLHPNEWLDGAIVTANFSNAVETYFYQNHPVVTELYGRHRAGEIAFVGTIATMAGSDNVDRERNAMLAAQQAKWNLDADGVVLTKYGGGAPHADMALTARICEELGMRTAVQVGPPDLSGDRSEESALLFNYPEVDAIVYSSGGNYVQWLAPEVDRVIASSEAAAAALASIQQLTASRVVGITSQQGASRLRSFVY
jgi:glycine reductase